MEKEHVVYLQWKTSPKLKRTTGTQCKSHSYVDGEKPDTKEHAQCNSIDVKFKIRQNLYSI